MIDRRMIPALGKEISRLGYGGMRFPKNGDEVDMDAAVQLLRKAYEMGINYFDTAMVYHKGESEKIFGKAFEPYPRDSYLIADKMSIWLCSDEEDMKARFYNQLKTLKTDYIDFYLVHSLNRNHYKKVKDLHCVEFLQQMKREGKIKHLGFSFHDTYQVFTQILNDYTWDFVQIQLNYLDWHNQGAEQLYRELERRNLPVMVMEPVRGGYLATALDCQLGNPLGGIAATGCGCAQRYERFAATGGQRCHNDQLRADERAGAGSHRPGGRGDSQGQRNPLHRLSVLHGLPDGCGHPGDFLHLLPVQDFWQGESVCSGL